VEKKVAGKRKRLEIDIKMVEMKIRLEDE